ncbi:MAG: hypothetical protein AAGD14_10915 [Planctomycetota bacterium]
MRRDVVAAVLGIVVGAATLAGGQDNKELRDELRELQRQAARLASVSRDPVEVPASVPVRETGFELTFFPVNDLTAPHVDYPAPANAYIQENIHAPLIVGIERVEHQPFGTIGDIAELVVTSVEPTLWEHARLTPQGRFLIAFQTRAVNEKVGRFLESLRARIHRSVRIECEMLDLPARLVNGLASGEELSDAQRTAIDGALEARGKRIFAASALGTLGAQLVVRHGRQIAVLADNNVEVAHTASTADPVIQIVEAGGSLAARAYARPDRSLAMDVDFRHNELLGIRRHETKRTGVMDMPDVRDMNLSTELTVKPGRWAVAGQAARDDGRVRIVLVRGWLLERGGAGP